MYVCMYIYIKIEIYRERGALTSGGTTCLTPPV